jgi:hypothetical protein
MVQDDFILILRSWYLILFFNYFVFDLIIIIIIINYYENLIKISYLLLKYLNRFVT